MNNLLSINRIALKNTKNILCNFALSFEKPPAISDNAWQICKSLPKFIDETIPLEEGQDLLSDSLSLLIQIEDQMQSIKINEGNNEDEIATAQSQIMLLLNPMISQLLPVLNATHLFLKKSKSRLQPLMRWVHQKIC
jgi:hypothetical protein